MKTTIKIEGMHCDGCAGRVRRVLDRKPGVRGVDVSYAGKAAVVQHNEDAANPRSLVELVRQAGYEAEVEE